MKRFAAEISLGLATSAAIMVIWGWTHGQPSTLFQNLVLWIGMAIFSLVGRGSLKRPRTQARRTGQTREALSLPGADEDVRRLVLEGQHIPAIKRHRELHGSTLREAAD